MQGNFYPVEIEGRRPGSNKNEPKKSRFTRFQIKLAAMLCLFLIAAGMTVLYMRRNIDFFAPQVIILQEPSLDIEGLFNGGDGMIARLDNDGSWAFFSARTGETLITNEKYASALPFSDGLAAVGIVREPSAGNIPGGFHNDFLWGYIDKTGEVIIPFEYSSVSMFYDGMAAAAGQDGKWGVINKSGEIIIPFMHGYISHIKAEAMLSFGHCIGYEWQIDNNGETIIAELREYSPGEFVFVPVLEPSQGDDWNLVTEGLTMAVKDGKWGYTDKSGKTVVPFIYDAPGFFQNGLAAVGVLFEDLRYGVINKNGGIVVPLEYEYISIHRIGRKDFMIASQNGKYGILSKKAKIITPFEYDMMTYAGDGIIAVMQNGLWGLLEIK
jgi:hypothetical protein